MMDNEATIDDKSEKVTAVLKKRKIGFMKGEILFPMTFTQGMTKF